MWPVALGLSAPRAPRPVPPALVQQTPLALLALGVLHVGMAALPQQAQLLLLPAHVQQASTTVQDSQIL